jgi:hypothetical protein
MARVACAVVIMAVYGACVPYAVPPTTFAAGASRTIGADARFEGHAEVGVSPFQLSRRDLGRRWDATLSGTLDHAGADNAWGGALAAGPIWHPWGPSRDADTTNRLMPQLVGRWTTSARAAAIRVIIESSMFADGPTDDGMSRMRGEVAYGAYLEAGPRWGSAARDGWAITIGLTMRTPAAAGIACCLL